MHVQSLSSEACSYVCWQSSVKSQRKNVKKNSNHLTLSTVLLKSVIALDFAAINKALIQFVYRFHCETIQGVIN